MKNSGLAQNLHTLATKTIKSTAKISSHFKRLIQVVSAVKVILKMMLHKINHRYFKKIPITNKVIMWQNKSVP